MTYEEALKAIKRVYKGLTPKFIKNIGEKYIFRLTIPKDGTFYFVVEGWSGGDIVSQGYRTLAEAERNCK